MKFVVVLAVLGVAFWIWNSKRKALLQQRQQVQQQATEALPMVACAHCGLHLARVDAVAHQGQWYCSQAHAQAGPQ